MYGDRAFFFFLFFLFAIQIRDTPIADASCTSPISSSGFDFFVVVCSSSSASPVSDLRSIDFTGRITDRTQP